MYKNCLVLKVLFLLTLSESSLENSNVSTWMQDLKKHLKQDFHAFQTVILVNQKSNDDKTDEILQTVISNSPTKIINIRLVKAKNIRTTIASRSIHLTTQFLTILSDATTDPKVFLKYILQISRGATLPQCLMIQLQGSVDHEKLFRSAWSERFLDLTILELFENMGNKNSATRYHSTRLNIFKEKQNTFLKLHQYNPFNESYVQKKFSSEDIIFPDKLNDLKGYVMNVFTFRSNFYVNMKPNASGYQIPVSGLKINLRRLLQEMQNFQINEISYPGLQIGSASCQRNKSTGIINKLYHGEFHFFTNSLIIPSGCKEYVNMFAFENENYRLVLLVPVTVHDDKKLSITSRSLAIGLSSMGLIVFICLIVRFLQLDEVFWQFFNLFKMLLGLSVNSEIRNDADRLLHPFVFFGFMIVSSQLYSLLTDIEIMVKSEKVLKTLEEVNRSNLVPIMFRNDKAAASALHHDNVIQDLMKKTQTPSQPDICFTWLRNHQNTTCLGREVDFEVIEAELLAEMGYTLAKVLPEVFMETPNSMMMEPKFPNAFRFERNMNRITQTGLKEKWINDLFNKTARRNSQISLLQNQSTLLVVLLWVITLGLSLSIIAFFYELLTGFIKTHPYNPHDPN